MAAITGAVTAVVGAAVAIGTSSAAAAKSKAAQRAAEGEAKKRLKEAKKEIQRMPMQELSLDLQAYKAGQEASQVAAAQSIQAAQQAEGRGLAAAVGRVQMADVEQQRGARLDKAAELQKLEMLKAKERQEASDKLASLSLAEAQGAQEVAAQEEMMAQQYTQQAVGAGVEAVKGAANLYSAVQGPFDPTGVQSSTQKAMNKLTSQDDIIDFQETILDDSNLLPAGITLPKGFGTLSSQELQTQLFESMGSGKEINALMELYYPFYTKKP